MNRLFLGCSRGVFLEIAVLGEFNERISVFRRRRFICKGGLKLAVHDDICVSTDGGSEMGIKRDVEGVVTIVVFRGFAGYKVFRTMH